MRRIDKCKTTKPALLAMTCGLILFGTASALHADNTNSQENSIRHGLSGFKADKSDKGKLVEPVVYGGSSAQDALEEEFGGSAAAPPNGRRGNMPKKNLEQSDVVLARSASDCSWVRMSTEGTYGTYSDYWPYVFINVRLYMKSLTYSGSQSDPNSCYKRWYFSKYVYHTGEIIRYPYRRMVSGSARRNNEAYLSTSHKSKYSGNLAVEPDERSTYHEAQLQNNAVISRNTKGTW